jgi:electron transport complex protein RnfB
MSAVITLTLMSLILGLGLAFASDYFHVEIDPRVEAVEAMLPGINCGTCGYPGCNAFANAIIDGEVTSLSLCKPGKDKNYDPIIAFLSDHPNKDGSVIKVKK